jgi:uncharacterized protein (TIGR03086 family)
VTAVDAALARSLADDQAALAHFATLVERVTPADLARPTPCVGWDVHALLDHVVGGNLLYAQASSGDAPDWSTRSDDHLGADHRGAYARSSEAVTDAFASAAAAGTGIALPFGTLPPAWAIPVHAVDTLVHGWDLAAACGFDRALDPGLAEAALAIIATYPAETWGDPRFFAHRVAPPPGATVTERLVAAVGRDPGWRPPGPPR